MTDELSLAGLTVLVVEDDFYLAEDARCALEDAGAKVLGPAATFDDARGMIDDHPVDCALLDINLGSGPDFTSARVMLARGVPVVFVTGYDPDVIPSDLVNVRCLQKPTNARRIIEAVSQLCEHP